jgi:hypothetical protein
MDRVNGANTVDIGGGKRGFRDRNLVAGLPGTQVPALHMNAVQEEILAVIETAGIVPSAANNAQLLAAGRALFGGVGSLGNTGYMRLPGGLIVQWGRVARASRAISATAVVAFPIAFPTACYVVIPSIDYDNAGLLDMFAGADTPTASFVVLLAGQSFVAEGTDSRVFGWHWIALGA